MVKTKAFLLNAISALYLLTTPVLTFAAENGTGVYLLGSRDRQMAVFHSRGMFLRNDFSYQTGMFYGIYMNGHKFESIKNWVAVNNTNLNYYSDMNLFGGTYMAGIELRLVSNELTVVPEVFNGITKTNENKMGLGDLKVTPLAIGWDNRGFFHYSSSISFYFPTGNYDPKGYANTCKNYLSINPEFAITFFNEYTRTDISADLGLLYNLKNPATNYQTGVELYSEYAFVQGIERHWGLGLVGYFYHQLTSDSGDGVPGGDYKGKCNGLGPIITYDMRQGRTTIGLMAKMYFVYGNENTLYSNVYTLGFSLRFW
ncbi:MAG: transporter [Bacteroides sp.]|jgi:hypothetical protein|nr:transporter [Bacteroides sp.]